MKQIQFSTALLSLLLLGLPINSNAYSQLNVIDSISGFSTIVDYNSNNNKDDVYLILKNDLGEILKISLRTDSDGNIDYEIPASYISNPGKYIVSIEDKSRKLANAEFNVLSNGADYSNSLINVSRGYIKSDGSDVSFVTVNLKDSAGNAVPNHDFSLISSRASDKIVKVSNNTFEISSTEPGKSILSAFDQTTGSILNNRESLIFSNSILASSNIAYAVGQGAHEFDISNYPESIEVNTNLPFTLEVTNDEGDLITDFTGEIEFSSSDPNAQLPNNFEFDLSDSGSHIFDFGPRFMTTGMQTLTLTDVDNQFVFKEITVNVLPPSGATGLVDNTFNADLVLTAPSSGITTENVITITGTAGLDQDITLFDDQEEIADIRSDENGDFTYTLENLTDGLHVFYVSILDQSGQSLKVSNEIEIEVDRVPPEIFALKISPKGPLSAGSEAKLQLFSEENLSKATATFDAEDIELLPTDLNSGIYEAILIMPEDAGNYPIDITISDALENEATLPNQKTIEVVSVVEQDNTILHNSSEEELSLEDLLENSLEEFEEETLPVEENIIDNITNNSDKDTTPPSDISSVTTVSEDKSVMLSWSAAQDNDTVAYYRIYFGLNKNDLNQIIETPSSATTYKVDNLTNGITYHFAVKAVDLDGNESLNFSIKKEETPGKYLTMILNNPPAEHSDTGPEITFLLLLLFSLSSYYLFRKEEV